MVDALLSRPGHIVSEMALATLLFSLNTLPYFINSKGASVKTSPIEATTVEAVE